MVVHRPDLAMLMGHWERARSDGRGVRWRVATDRRARSSGRGGYPSYLGGEEDETGSPACRIGVEQVEDRLLRHPGMASWDVIQMPCSTRGGRGKAHAVPQSGTENGPTSAEEIPPFAREQLAAYEFTVARRRSPSSAPRRRSRPARPTAAPEPARLRRTPTAVVATVHTVLQSRALLFVPVRSRRSGPVRGSCRRWPISPSAVGIGGLGLCAVDRFPMLVLVNRVVHFEASRRGSESCWRRSSRRRELPSRRPPRLLLYV